MKTSDGGLGAIGYLPYSQAFDNPCDRRRFPRYAAMRGLPFEVVDSWDNNEIVVLSTSADVTNWVRAPRGRKIVVDLPDAYLDERAGWKRAFRGLAKWVGGESRRPVFSYLRAIQRLLERADAVVCSTAEQAANIAAYNENVHPVVDLLGEFQPVPPAQRESSCLEVVWEGLPATLPAVRQVLPALHSIAKTQELRLHLVTDLKSPRYMNRFAVRRTAEMVKDWGVDIELHSWSVDTLATVCSNSDLAIVPVDLSDPMALGKPENRIRIFWRLGLPVLASACPAHLRVAELAGLGDGLLCATSADWKRALEELWLSPDLRLEHAIVGQELALSEYSDDSLARRWDRVFATLGHKP